MMKAVEKRDITKLRKVADAGLGIRRWLTKFSGKENKSEKEDEATLKETSKSVAKSSLAVWGARVLAVRKLSPQVLLTGLAIGAAVEVAKRAGKITDSVDKKMQSVLRLLKSIRQHC